MSGRRSSARRALLTPLSLLFHAPQLTKGPERRPPSHDRAVPDDPLVTPDQRRARQQTANYGQLRSTNGQRDVLPFGRLSQVIRDAARSANQRHRLISCPIDLWRRAKGLIGHGLGRGVIDLSGRVVVSIHPGPPPSVSALGRFHLLYERPDHPRL